MSVFYRPGPYGPYDTIPSDHIFTIKGPIRWVIADETYRDLIEQIDDIMILAEGENQYDLRPGFEDIGASRVGAEVILRGSSGSVKSGIVDVPLVQTVADKIGERTLLIGMIQKSDKMIRTYAFYDARLFVPADEVPNLRGECSSVPVLWTFQGGMIFDQIKPDGW